MGRAALIVDSSAIVAIILGEPEASMFFDTIKAAAPSRMSTANYIETSLRLGGLGSGASLLELDPLIATLGIQLEPLSAPHAYAAREAGQRFGRGHHPAALNFGDCCVYALARVAGEPLLFKGDDFGRTDIAVALPL